MKFTKIPCYRKNFNFNFLKKINIKRKIKKKKSDN